MSPAPPPKARVEPSGDHATVLIQQGATAISRNLRPSLASQSATSEFIAPVAIIAPSGDQATAKTGAPLTLSLWSECSRSSDQIVAQPASSHATICAAVGCQLTQWALAAPLL